jgi:hypothetical protein
MVAALRSLSPCVQRADGRRAARSATGPGARLSTSDYPLECRWATRSRPGSASHCSADHAPDSPPPSEGPSATATLPESRRQPWAGSGLLPRCCHRKVAVPWCAPSPILILVLSFAPNLVSISLRFDHLVLEALNSAAKS